jgi:hypothetical protein
LRRRSSSTVCCCTHSHDAHFHTYALALTSPRAARPKARLSKYRAHGSGQRAPRRITIRCDTPVNRKVIRGSILRTICRPPRAGQATAQRPT